VNGAREAERRIDVVADVAPGQECVPVACTLTATELTDRSEEWRSFYRTSVDNSESEPTTFRLLLRAGDDVLAAAVSLSGREKACCAFFEFAIDIEVERRWLVVRVPEGAEGALGFFMDMLQGTAST
jgi:hypothetical protein